MSRTIDSQDEELLKRHIGKYIMFDYIKVGKFSKKVTGNFVNGRLRKVRKYPFIPHPFITVESEGKDGSCKKRVFYTGNIPKYGIEVWYNV